MGRGRCSGRHRAVAAGASNDFYASPRFVVTPYVAAVSWLFEQLWRVFRPVLDHVDKFEFFGRLGNSLTRYHATTSGTGTERDAVGAVVHEAYAILDDIASGSFAGPAVTSGYGIHDDAIPQAERPPYVSVEEANRWLENPGDACPPEPFSLALRPDAAHRGAPERQREGSTEPRSGVQTRRRCSVLGSTPGTTLLDLAAGCSRTPPATRAASYGCGHGPAVTAAMDSGHVTGRDAAVTRPTTAVAPEVRPSRRCP